MALEYGYAEIVVILVNTPGIDVNLAVDQDELTPLMCAAFNARPDLVKILLDSNKVDINKSPTAAYTKYIDETKRFTTLEVVTNMVNNPANVKYKTEFTKIIELLEAEKTKQSAISLGRLNGVGERLAGDRRGIRSYNTKANGGSVRKNKTKRRKNRTGKTIKKKLVKR